MSFPYRLRRIGVIMEPEPGNEFEAEGVLNPGSGRDADGRLHLLPRLVAAGNVSRVGSAEVMITDGVPTGVERRGVVLAPDREFERGRHHAGTEDPRVTFVAALGVHVMTYVAYGQLGPRTALATSADLRSWTRLGPVHFRYDDRTGIDLNLFHNKDTTFFGEPVVDPDGVPSLAVLHRPMWDVDETSPGQGNRVPPGLIEQRQSMWISFVPLAEVQQDLSALVEWRGHRFLAGPEFAYEELKIGGGPPPLRVPEGWLLLHHGVTGRLERAFAQQRHVNYAAGGMILDAEQPWRVLNRSAEPLLSAETESERHGTVPNVVFPTAIERIGDRHFVFYGMADSRIGVAELEKVT